jgi:accessory gene regulator protein AgrB
MLACLVRIVIFGLSLLWLSEYIIGSELPNETGCFLLSAVFLAVMAYAFILR